MSKSAELVRLIQARAGIEPPTIGLVLGSGLGHLAEAVEGVSIDYADLDGFPHAGVSGHNPKLVIGDLEGVRVAVFGAREHYYEKGNPAAMRPALEVLRALGPQGLLVNVARGSVVDEAALIACLQNGSLGGAALDVFEDEPRVPEALLALDQVVLTPHMASGTHETRQAMADLTLANLRAGLAGERLPARAP